jgi:cation:H+ antiporter
MGLFISIAILGLSVYILTKSADYLTTYSEKLGLLWGMSSFLIGATIVAVGTSLPELVSSLYAVTSAGETMFVADNIIGSNIANAMLILGFAGVFAKSLKVNTSLINIDLPFFFMSMGMFVFFALDGTINWYEGILLLIFFVAFTIYTTTSKPELIDRDEMHELKEQFHNPNKHFKRLRILKYGLIIVSMMILISLSAKYFVDSLIDIASGLGVTTTLVTLTIAALGTSLPEIITSIQAIRHKNHGMALGNIFGSNTFNITLVGGLPALFSDLAISPEVLSIGIPFLIFATFVAIFTTIDNKVAIWEGLAMLFIYFIFLGKIFQLF